MGKYLMIWELNLAHTPTDPKERGAGYEMLMAMVKQDLAKGLTKDWGNFVGEGSGYCLVEGSEIEIATIVENECFMHFASVGGYNFWALNKDQLQSYYFVGGAVILHAGHNDSVIVRISDDLSSGLDYFKCQIKAINRG